LEEINEYWNVIEFDFVVWGKRETPCMLGGLRVGEIIERLDEDQMTLSTLNANRHVTPFKAEVELRIKIFSDVNETLDQWINVQKLWSSLEPVFTGGDIARAMPL
jgi:dynein heavy chain